MKCLNVNIFTFVYHCLNGIKAKHNIKIRQINAHASSSVSKQYVYIVLPYVASVFTVHCSSTHISFVLYIYI